MRSLFDRIAAVDPSRWAINEDLSYGMLFDRVNKRKSLFDVCPVLEGDVTDSIVVMLQCMRDGVTFALGRSATTVHDVDCAFWAWSSGSTGISRPIAVAASVVVPCIEYWAETLIQTDDRVILVHSSSVSVLCCSLSCRVFTHS
jgi:hypothetical protein